MTLTEDFNIPNLRDANREIQDLEAAAIERARLHLEATKSPLRNFKNENGFSVRVLRDSLLEDSYIDVVFYHTDVQGRGETKSISIPRSIILGGPTQKEKDFAEYERLKAQFEK